MRVSTHITTRLNDLVFSVTAVVDIIPAEAPEPGYPGCDECINYVVSAEIDEVLTSDGYRGRDEFNGWLEYAEELVLDHLDNNHDSVLCAVRSDCTYLNEF